jgi:hypothetical protein
VDLYTSRALIQVSEDDFGKEYFFGDRYLEWKKKIVSSFQEGVLTFHYAVTESANFLARNFPTKFEFFQNGRKYEQNGNLFYRGIGRVKSIRASAMPENLFMASLGQTIVDHRFRDNARHVDSIVYRSTNAFFAPTNEPVLQETFAARVKRASLYKQP